MVGAVNINKWGRDVLEHVGLNGQPTAERVARSIIEIKEAKGAFKDLPDLIAKVNAWPTGLRAAKATIISSVTGAVTAGTLTF